MSAARAGRLWTIGAVLLAVLLTAATYLLVIAPARTETATVQSQVEDATLTQTTLRHRLQELETASQDTAALQAAGAAAAAALPETADTQGLLRRVQSVATASRVTVGAVAVEEPEAAVVAGVWAIPVTVELVGAPSDLVAVVAALQGPGGRALTVTSTSLQSAGGPTTLDLSLRMYCTTDPGSTPGASGDAGGGSAPAAPAAGGSGGTDAGTAPVAN